MANKKVGYNDIFDEGLFDKAIKGAESLLKVLDRLEGEFKKILETTSEISKQDTFKDVEALRKREKAINDNRKAVESLDAIEKERIKLEQRLKTATDERAKANASLRIQIQEANRANKEAARIAGDVGAYKQQSALLNKLRNDYKDLALTYGENNKEAKKLLKEVQALDRQLKDLDDTVGQNQRSVGSYKRAVADLEKGLNKIKGTVVFIALIKLVELIQQNERGANEFNKTLTIFTTTLAVFVDTLVQAGQNLTKFANPLEAISSAFDGFQDRVEKAVESSRDLIDAETDSTNTLARLNNELGDTLENLAGLAALADDDTQSLEAQEKATVQLLTATTDLLNKEAEIAREEERIAKQRRDDSAAKRKDGKADAELEKALSEATLNRIRTESELTEFTIEAESKIRRLKRDSLELELDILIDAADNLKTIRERIIADETKNVFERRALLKKTREDIDQSFSEQIKKIEEFAKVSIDSNDLINESDTKTLNEKVKALKLDEITQTRLLEVIRDRRTAQQDLTEANRDLTESERNLASQQADNLLTTRALFDLQQQGANLRKILNNLEKEREKLEIEGLQKRILTLEKNSPALAEAQAELNAKLLAQQEDRINKQIKQEQQAQQAIIALVEGLAEKRFQAQENAIEKELSAVRQRQEALRQISREGQADAEESLAVEQRKEAELERKREQQARRRARLELALSAVETYSNKVTAGDENALQSTITDISLLQAFVSSLPAFFSGTENVADSLGAPHLNTARDQYIIRADGGERILNNRQNSLLPRGMSNDMLVDYALTAYTGKASAPVMVGAGGISKQDLQQVMFDAVERIPTYNGREYKATERAIVDTIKRHGKTERRHTKTGGIW